MLRSNEPGTNLFNDQNAANANQWYFIWCRIAAHPPMVRDHDNPTNWHRMQEYNDAPEKLTTEPSFCPTQRRSSWKEQGAGQRESYGQLLPTLHRVAKQVEEIRCHWKAKQRPTTSRKGGVMPPIKMSQRYKKLPKQTQTKKLQMSFDGNFHRSSTKVMSSMKLGAVSGMSSSTAFSCKPTFPVISTTPVGGNIISNTPQLRYTKSPSKLHRYKDFHKSS